MAKKDKNERGSKEKKGKSGNEPFLFLGTRFAAIDKTTATNHILLLIITTIIMKFVVVFFTTAVFHSFIDYFDIGVYLNSVTPLTQGQLPYIDYAFEYPILTLVPILLAFLPAVLTQSGLVFVLSFQLLMILCDLFIVISIYLIGIRIYHETTAFYGGLIYATAFSTAYFVITKSDAFPTALLMAGLLFAVYGMGSRGYASASAGFFAKLFPAVSLPFMIAYNAKKTSVKEELISAIKIFLIFCIVLLLPLAILRPTTLSSYLFATGGSVGVYVNTATYTIFAGLSEVFPSGISLSFLSTIMYLIMAAVLLLLFAIAFIDREKKEKTLLVLTLCALFSLVFFTKFHSPQYLVWFTPLLALLVADDIIKIGLFYLSQVFAYIEFPLLFGTFYTNTQYVNPIGSSGWYLTLLFFTAENIVFVTLMYFTVRPECGIVRKIKSYYALFSQRPESNEKSAENR
ncbi:hypothetical protein [Methanoregula sp.]|uniref:hypothetical protein n=1 Tax=Methanoregula sp. TaxID=2052170 RepID=UPI002CFD0F37|nr:hypothetical protein [Methanoregula sp.]HVP95685.1 hypothetical protein [Methanoregula sp.]